MGRPKKTEEVETPKVSRYRDEKGLLKNVEFKFTEDGLVNWLAMIPEKFIVAKEEFKHKPFEELKDNEKLILLGGFKYVAKLRGYNSVHYNTLAANESFVSLACAINWLPNFETEDEEVCFESCADAHPGSTDKNFYIFLTTIAENRAFSRCVRNFLNINVLGKEEMADQVGNVESNETNEASKTGVNVHGLLSELMNEEGISFKRLQNVMKSEMPEAETWTDLSDILKPTVLAIINRIKNRKKESVPATVATTAEAAAA